jgi:ribosomal protein L7/L12
MAMDWTDPNPRLARIEQRLQELETQVMILSAAAGLPYVPSPLPGPQGNVPQIPQEIIDLAHSGRKIEAIKQYRALTGANLEDSKNVVDRL